MERLARLITGRPLLTLLAVVGVTVLAISGMVDLASGELRLRLDPSTARIIPEEGRARLFYEEMRRRFGNDDTLTVALVADDVFCADVLRRVARMTERFGKVSGVRRVLSLSTAPNVRGVEGELSMEPFYRAGEDDPATLAALRRDVLESPIFAGTLVSADGRGTAILVELVPMSDAEFLEAGVDRRLALIAEEERGPTEIWITGPPRLRAETSRTLLSDLRFVIPAAFGVAAGVALLAFRTVRGVLVPTGTVVVALIWTLGAVAWSGRPLNLVTTILPPLVLTIGLTYAIHVLADYYQKAREDRESAARAALEEVALAVLLTALTTCVGTLSLAVSPISAVREFGIFATVGVVATLVSALTFAPAVLQLLPIPARGRPSLSDARWGRTFEALARFDLRHARPILAASLVLAVLAFYGSGRVRVSNDLVQNFRPDAPVRADFEAVNERLGGANPIFVVLETDLRDGFKQPENLRTVEALQEWLRAQPRVGTASSLVDHLKVVHWAFHDNDPAYLTIPETASLTDQLLFFGGSRELQRFVDVRYQITRILVRAEVIDSIGLGDLVARIRERLAQLPPHIRGEVTGSSVLMTQAIDEIARGQVQSLSLAFLLIYGILVLSFMSFRVGLIALIPNAMPVLFYFGAMGFTGIPLNTTTSLVACIVLGIAVDDTIHFVARFNQLARERGDEQRGAIETMRLLGKPVTWTTVALCLGLLTLTLTNLRSQVQFGTLGALTLFVAWALEMTMTVALCGQLRIVTIWDLLKLDLGHDPQSAIPIFRGLRRSQAKVVALMATLLQVEKGQRLFRDGEAGDALYVVLDGQLQASIERPGGRRMLGRALRGDLVGEVGPFHGRRTADVDAVEETRLLRLTAADLERVRRRYPRIGATVYRNLSELLAHRVADSTLRIA
jgi:predicted RND superfamily exporter protein